MTAVDEPGKVRVAFLDEAGTEILLARVKVHIVDLALVDTLARLQLEAHRIGWSMRLGNPGEELVALLELAGLSDLMSTATGADP